MSNIIINPYVFAAAESPAIVTTNLQLYLDAGNTSSYPGTGTTWTDLSGNGNTGTFNNGPVFNSDAGGSIAFDGINDYIDLGQSLTLEYNRTTGYTLNAWVYVPTGIASGAIFSRGLNGTSFYSVQFLYCDSSFGSGPKTLGMVMNGQNTWVVSTGNIITTNAWNNVAAVHTASSVKFYVNGTLINTTGALETPYTNATIGSTQNGRLANPFQNNFWFGGRIAIMLAYNRGLSDAELLQNFNAHKSRYGL
jgi:hypothetical protein